MKRLSYLIFIVLLAFVLPQSGSGQSVTKDSGTLRISRDITHFLDVSRDLFIAPSKFETSDWQNLIMTISMTSALFSADPAVDKFARANHSKLNDRIFSIDKHFGVTETLLLTMGVYGAGFISGESRLRRTGLKAFEAFVFSEAVTSLLKLSFGRIRPYGSKDPINFSPFHGGNLFSSLPSGHTAGAFSIAVVMSHAYDSYLWKSLWYGSAALMAGSRIYHQKHWLSDTFLSFAISYSIAEFVVHYGEKYQDSEKHPLSINLIPVVTTDFFGLSLAIKKL